MSFLAMANAVLPELPNLTFCNNNNCSNLTVTCCGAGKPSALKLATCALNDQPITHNYILTNQYTIFQEYKNGIILNHSSPNLHHPDDPSLLCLFADETFSRSKSTHKRAIQKMVLDGNHIVAEYHPQQGMWNDVKNIGIIIQLSKEEWDAFQPNSMSR